MCSIKFLKKEFFSAATLLAVLFSSSTFANNSALLGLSAKSDPNNLVKIELELSDKAGEIRSFSIKTPPQIILDMEAVHLAIEPGTKSYNLGPLKTINVIETGEQVRLIFNLDNLGTYDLSVNEKKATLTIGEKPVALSSNKYMGLPEMNNKKAVPSRKLKKIDFRRRENNAGVLELHLSDPKTVIDVKREGTQIFLSLKDIFLPKKLENLLDVSDFATAVDSISITQTAKDIEVVLNSGRDFEYMVYQTDEKLNIEVLPHSLSQQQLRRVKEKKYAGDRLSLNFQDIEVRAVLQLLADFTGLNMVASDSVSGRLTLRLDNVPWDQALDIILKSKGLGMRRQSNVIMIAPASEIAARERSELEATQQVSELAPLRSEFVQINYAKAVDIALLLKGDSNSLLSTRGNVSVDDRTNTLLLQDTSDKIDEIRTIIRRLDTPVRQVEIAARIVTAKKKFTRSLGLRWGSASRGLVDSDKKFGIASNIEDANSLSTEVAPSAIADRLNVDLPLTSPFGRIAFSIARLGQASMLDLELQAAQTEELTHVIASPKLITSNQREAVIKQGKEIPYLEASSSGSTSVSFKDAVLELRVTPQITPDDRIIMDLTVKQDVVSSSTETVSSDSLPVIDTKEITTQVLVNNGETIVLGGIYERNKNGTKKKVPFFGDLPVISYLFKNTDDEDVRDELLIFVTPQIIKELSYR